jgi:hypothetical protein
MDTTPSGRAHVPVAEPEPAAQWAALGVFLAVTAATGGLAWMLVGPLGFTPEEAAAVLVALLSVRAA